MVLKSWGNFPKVLSKVISIERLSDIGNALKSNDTLIAYGNGRSYGDSALGKAQLDMRGANHFISFDQELGVLKVEAGVLLADILKYFVPRGWFLTISPGTKLITVGGAIASDIHGKNHHHAGCFSESLVSMKVQLADGRQVECSTDNNSDLFNATCGGQGLTGIVLNAELQMKKIQSSQLATTTIKTFGLQETFAAFESRQQASYSVAWIDCMATGNKLGRSLLTTGEFLNDNTFSYKPKKTFSVPFYFPSFVLNKWFVKLFNILYFNKVRKQVTHAISDIDSFFYPLDAISQWNKIYGKKGFVQYQFILPLSSSFEGIKEALELISSSGRGSFLAVLKLYGKENQNYLSFPMEGYSLALDFKLDDSLFDFLNELDEIVVKHKGRVYLAKDARMSAKIFEKGYPKLNKFKQVRNKFDPNKQFSSSQSSRLGL